MSLKARREYNILPRICGELYTMTHCEKRGYNKRALVCVCAYIELSPSPSFTYHIQNFNPANTCTKAVYIVNTNICLATISPSRYNGLHTQASESFTYAGRKRTTTQRRRIFIHHRSVVMFNETGELYMCSLVHFICLKKIRRAFAALFMC